MTSYLINSSANEVGGALSIANNAYISLLQETVFVIPWETDFPDIKHWVLPI